MSFAVKVEVCVSDHVHHDQGADLVQCALSLDLLSEVPTTVQAVRVGPLLQSLLSVEEDQPVAE